MLALSAQWGIHHVVLPAVLETPPGRDCHGHLEVYSDRIELRGVDTMMSLSLPFLTAGDVQRVRRDADAQQAMVAALKEAQAAEKADAAGGAKAAAVRAMVAQQGPGGASAPVQACQSS